MSFIFRKKSNTSHDAASLIFEKKKLSADFNFLKRISQRYSALPIMINDKNFIDSTSSLSDSDSLRY